VTENVYLGHDNEIALILKNDSTAVDLASINRITIKMGQTLISSTNGNSDPILWNQSSYVTGEVHIKIGELTSILEEGLYNAPITVYDAISTAGIVWGNVRVRVWPNPEST
jgi:hypothetical protein